jgi:hypothetical protein
VEFPLDIRTELNLGGAWEDISSDVYLRDTKQITRGVRDQGSAADPSTLSFTLNNRSGKYSPRNAMSPLYGKIGRNTQVRLSLPGIGDSYLQLDGSPTGFASTADKSALDITSDFDLRVEGELNWFGPENQILIGKWDDPNNQCSYLLQIYQGAVNVRYSTTGDQSVSLVWGSQPLPGNLPARAALRATVDINTTAHTSTLCFYWAPDMDSTWVQFGQPVVVDIGTGYGTVFSGTAPLQIGVTDYRHSTLNAIPRYPVVGRVYRAEVRNGINGTVVANPDFRALADRATGTTDATGNVWALNGNAEIRDRADRYVGEISYWPVTWTPDAADVWTSVKASGILRRMGQGNKPLDSTLRRRIPSAFPLAYWPCEEAKDSTKAYSPIPGVRPMTLTNVDWAAQDSLESSAPLPTLHALSVLDARIPGASNTGAWHVECVYNAFGKIPPSTGAEAPLLTIYTAGGSAIVKWQLTAKQTVAHIYGYNDVGTKVIDQPIGVGDDIFNLWNRLQFYANNNSDGTYSARINWQDIGGEAGGFTVTGTGTVGYVNHIYQPFTALNDGWAFGHLFVLPYINQSLLTGSDDAYVGEDAYTRMMRLASEEGISIARVPGALPVTPVGYQRADALLNLFEAAAEADGGLLTESPDRLNLRYRDRSSMYSQTPKLTLAYNQPGLGPDLEPVDDDTHVYNDVTVTRDSGSSFRAFLDSGSMSIETPPLGIGRYDTSYTLSLADDDQPQAIANWRLHLGTYDGARWPTVSVMLHKPGAEALIPDVLGLREGDKLKITGLPQWVSNDDVELIVHGWSEEIDPYSWTVTFNCVPAGPWNVATLPVDAMYESFEDATYELNLAFGGAQPWARATDQRLTGSYSLKSGAISASQDSTAILTLPPGAGTLEFWYRTDSQPTGDYLYVWLDGVEALRASGATPWTKASLDVSATSVVTFGYHKDATTNTGADAVWIDAVRVGIPQESTMRADAVGSVLSKDAGPTDTVVYVLPEPFHLWTTDPDDFPFDVRIGGEVMTVSAVSGTVADQFDRTKVNGWGTTDTGQTWTLTGTTANFSIKGV